MCGMFGTYEAVTPVTLQNGRTVSVDSCIASMVQALNDAGLTTTLACCGHGLDDGLIMLADGRALKVMRCVIAESGMYETRRADGSTLPSVRPGWGGVDWHPPLLGWPGDEWETLP